jgi:hypothetical protein
MNGLMDFLQQTSRTAGQTATGLVDLATLALRPLGYSIPDEKVFGTTKWAEKKGLLAPESQTPAGLAGQTVGNLLFPLGAGKSAQIASGLNRADDALTEGLLTMGAKRPAYVPKSQAGMIVPGGMDAANRNIQALSKGQRVSPVKVGLLTDEQFAQINALRKEAGYDLLPSKEVHYIGKHHTKSRGDDGYLPQDILKQLMSGLDDTAKAATDDLGRVNLVATKPRFDGYASTVDDTVALMPSGNKTIAEVFSVIPKGDKKTRTLLAKEKAGVLPGDQRGVSHFQRIEQNQPIRSVVSNEDVRHWIAQDNATGFLGLPANNTGMDRARALDFDTDVYQGTGRAKEILANKAFDVDEAGRGVDGVWTSTSKPYAQWIADHNDKGDVLELMLRNGNKS